MICTVFQCFSIIDIAMSLLLTIITIQLVVLLKIMVIIRTACLLDSQCDCYMEWSGSTVSVCIQEHVTVMRVISF